VLSGVKLSTVAAAFPGTAIRPRASSAVAKIGIFERWKIAAS
jgi:hypothetical protein